MSTPSKKAIASAVTVAVAELLRSGARSAKKFVDARTTVTATRRFKPRKNQKTTDIVLTIGKPNAHARMIIRRYGVPKNVVVRHYAI